MHSFKTSMGNVQIEYDLDHHGQTVAVGYKLGDLELDLDFDCELIMNIERELHRQAMDEWNSNY